MKIEVIASRRVALAFYAIKYGARAARRYCRERAIGQNVSLGIVSDYHTARTLSHLVAEHANRRFLARGRNRYAGGEIYQSVSA